MSRLDELIAELCPNGVEYRYILEVADVLYGYPCDATKFNDVEIGIPLARIRNVLEGTTTTYTTEEIPEQYNLQYGDLLVGMDGNFHVGNWRMNNGILCQRVCKFWSKDENSIILNRFLSHLLPPIMKKIENSKQSGTVKHLLAKDIKMIKLPVPPLEVQREIVHILDSFTLLTAELTAELTARKKQYKFYRDKILNFGNKAAVYRMSELCESIADGDHMPPPKSDEGIPFITISNVNEYHNIDFENTMYVPESYYNSLAEKRKPHKGDILYTVVGSYGIPVCVEDDKKFVFQRHIAILRPNKDIIKSRYMFHAMQSTDFKIQADKSAKGAAQKTIALSALDKMKMPVPSLDVQEKIIKVLDNFESICTDLNIGLPAEIEARQKQYEYYRDLLLTFAEKDNMLLTDGRTDGRTDRSDQS